MIHFCIDLLHLLPGCTHYSLLNLSLILYPHCFPAQYSVEEMHNFAKGRVYIRLVNVCLSWCGYVLPLAGHVLCMCFLTELGGAAVN